MEPWKGFLSNARREVLIKAVAQAIPIYQMMCFKIPYTLCSHINSAIARSGGEVLKLTQKFIGDLGISLQPQRDSGDGV